MKICKIINFAIINLIIQSFLLYIFDVTFFEFNKHQKCITKNNIIFKLIIAKLTFFSKNLLYTRSVKCNVRIIYRICANINAIIVVALILLIWRNCLFHDIIDLMFRIWFECLTNSSRKRNSFRKFWILNVLQIDFVKSLK